MGARGIWHSYEPANMSQQDVLSGLVAADGFDRSPLAAAFRFDAQDRHVRGDRVTRIDTSVVIASPENTGRTNSKVISRAMKLRSPPIFVGSVAVSSP